MELSKPTASLLSPTGNNNNNSNASGSAAANVAHREGPAGTGGAKVPEGGASLMMGAAHGNLAGPLQSPAMDGKTAAVAFGGAGVTSDEKGAYGKGGNPHEIGVSNGGALGMGGAGRLGLDANGNAQKRPSKEETV